MSFTLDMKKFVEKANRNVDAVVRKIIIDISLNLTYKSPVGDPSLWDAEFVKAATSLGWIGAGYVGGRFKGNWDYGVGSAPTQTYDTIDKSGSVSQERIKSKIPANPSGKIHYLVNNLPYAQKLEDGYSSQAPHGMVKLTVIKFQSIVDNAAQGMA